MTSKTLDAANAAHQGNNDIANVPPLQPFLPAQSSTFSQQLRVIRCLGTGSAGFVFQVSLNSVMYALKMFKFYRSERIFSKFREPAKRAHYDSFLVECRAYAAIINKNLNGHHTPFCHGWLHVPEETERMLARRFHVPRFLWDRPNHDDDMEQEQLPLTEEYIWIRGILMEYIEGNTIANVPLTPPLANDMRIGLRELHGVPILHGDIRAANILIRAKVLSGSRVVWIDLSLSKIPSAAGVRSMSADMWRESVVAEEHALEVGLILLCANRINNRMQDDDSAVLVDHVADVAAVALKHTGMTSVAEVTAAYNAWNWCPPEASVWRCAHEAPTPLASFPLVQNDSRTEPEQELND